MLKHTLPMVIISLGFIATATPAPAAKADEPTTLTGGVLKLSEITDKTFDINVGGLLIVIVRDSGSRPPQDIKVEAGRAFQVLGVVRGTQTDQGQALMGGG